MNNIFFTSDTHAFHDRILEFCHDTRQGTDAEEMTWLMVDAWNSVVKPGDVVYHTGDFSFRSKDHIAKFKNALNGQIHLILGNHDSHIKKDKNLQSLFASVNQTKNVKIRDTFFILSHFPYAEWWECHRGSVHIHGHVHGGKQNLQHQQQYKIFDAGIDARQDNKMLPFHIDEVLTAVKDRAIMPHH